MDKQAIVRGLVDTWLPRLFLSGWIINIELKDRLCAEDKDTEAEVSADFKYHDADLKIFPPFWKRPENQERIILHELVHLLLWRIDPYMGKAGDEALEEVCQTITMAFYNAYRDG